jgi:hypothetical protein
MLDTNLVEYARRHQLGTENACVAAWSDPAHARLWGDLAALDRLLMLASRYGTPEFRVAPESLRELARSTAVDAGDVLAWARAVAAYAAHDDWSDEWSSVRQAPVFADFVRPGDAVLVAEAMRLNCGSLLTCDYRLVRQRQRISRVSGVDVLTPSDVLL